MCSCCSHLREIKNVIHALKCLQSKIRQKRQQMIAASSRSGSFRRKCYCLPAVLPPLSVWNACSQQTVGVPRVHCAPSSRPLMEVLNRTDPVFTPGVQPELADCVPLITAFYAWLFGQSSVHLSLQAAPSALVGAYHQGPWYFLASSSSSKSSFSCSRLSHWCPQPGIAKGLSC